MPELPWGSCWCGRYVGDRDGAGVACSMVMMLDVNVEAIPKEHGGLLALAVGRGRLVCSPSFNVIVVRPLGRHRPGNRAGAARQQYSQ